jgi:hypothetical protein
MKTSSSEWPLTLAHKEGAVFIGVFDRCKILVWSVSNPVANLTILSWLPPQFLASSFARQSLFDPLLLPGLEIKGVFLSFLYDVFL